jgi:hypothetical protein
VALQKQSPLTQRVWSLLAAVGGSVVAAGAGYELLSDTGSDIDDWEIE